MTDLIAGNGLTITSDQNGPYGTISIDHTENAQWFVDALKHDLEMQNILKRMIKESIKELLMEDGSNPFGIFTP